MVMNLLEDWRRARAKDKNITVQQPRACKKWNPPPEDWLKINVDATCISGAEYVGVDCVVRYTRGRFDSASRLW